MPRVQSKCVYDPTQIKVSKLAYDKFKLKLDKGEDSDEKYRRKS
jgi:hypothetical protein